MASNETTWRELHRGDDPDRARTIATTIASMGFDVRVVDGSGQSTTSHETDPGPPPYVVHVPQDDVAELGQVLHEIIDEQDEFDAALAERERYGKRFRRQLFLVVIIALMTLLGLLGLLRV